MAVTRAMTTVRKRRSKDDPYGYAGWVPTALIDPPYGGTLEEWLAFRASLRRLDNVAPVLREADVMIARLRRGERR